jgi:nucleoside phosphorylase
LLTEFPSCELVVNAGTAGANPGTGLAIGDVVVASRVAFFDRRVSSLNDACAQRHASGFGTELWEHTEQFCLGLNNAGISVKRAAVGTGSSFEPSPSDISAMLAHGVAVKEMEAAGVAGTSAVFNRPCLVLKAVSDIVGSDTGGDDFTRNLEQSMASLAQGLPTAVDQVLHMLTAFGQKKR